MSNKQSHQLFLFILFFTVGISVAIVSSLSTVRNILIAVLAIYSLIIDKPSSKQKLQKVNR